MRNKKLKGFGLIGLIITVAIILVLVFGYKQFKGQEQKNQVEAGNDAIKQAQDAADKQRQHDQDLQNEIQDLQPDFSPDTYHNIENNAKKLNQ